MRNPRLLVLLAGDVITLALVTLVGFARHNELGTAGARVLTTFVPSVIAWLLVAPHLGVFDQQRITDMGQLWRPFWAMVLAAPLAGWLRGAWLNAPVLPVFVVILGGVSAIAIFIWRLIYWGVFSRRSELFRGRVPHG